MPRLLMPRIITIVFLATLLSAASGYCAIRVGVGETLINPPIGNELAGYTRTQPSDGIHDDLHSRALVIEGDNGVSSALVSVALLEIRRDLYDAVRERISTATGIPVQNVVISCTNTHSGPRFRDSSYVKTLVDSMVASAVEAWRGRIPGRIGFGSASVPGLGMTNRLMLYGGTHPDPEAGIIKIEDAKGRLIGVAFNYGCHPSTLDLHNYKYSEDWPYYSIKGIKEKVGKNVWVAYFQSTQGDIKVGYSAELSAIGANIPVRTFAFAEYKGNMMAGPVTKALATIKTSPSADVAVAEKTFELPGRDGYRLSADEARKASDIAKAELAYREKRTDIFGPRAVDAARIDNYLATLRLRAAIRFNDPNRPKTIPLFQQAVRIGNAVLVTLPCEPFAEIGLAIKQQSPLENTFLLGLANARGGYLPTVAEFREEGYEVLDSPFAPEAVQELIDHSLGLIHTVMKPAE